MADNNNESEFKYVYPIEELNKLVEQIEMGITPMVSEDMMNEAYIRRNELLKQATGEDYSDIDNESTAAILQRHSELVKKSIESEKHKATKEDVMIINISDDQKKKIRDEMSISIVRCNPNDPYNKTDEQLFGNEERRKVEVKIRSLRRCYYNQRDYLNAYKIINEAIEVSLGKYGNSDFPELSYEEAIKKFNDGQIKLAYDMPKLFINHSTQLTDTEILKGIVNGEVTLADKKQDNNRLKNTVKNRKYKPVTVDYDVTSDTEFNQMMEAHRKGYDTPMSTAIRFKGAMFNPTSIPNIGDIFGNSKINRRLDQNGEPILFDWFKEGAGKSYYNMIHGKEPNLRNFLSDVNKMNGGKLDSVLENNARDFLSSMKKVGSYGTPEYNYTIPNYEQPSTNRNYNVQAAQMEKQLLESITLNSNNR